jgi:glycosyltransferase involved in cell wall biosynthesis
MGQLVAELLDAGHDVQLFVAPIDASVAEVAALKARGAKIEVLPEPERDYVTLREWRRRLDRYAGRSISLLEEVRKFDPAHVFINQGSTWCAAAEPFIEVLSQYPGRYSLLCHSSSGEHAFSGEHLRTTDTLAKNARRMFFNSRWLKGRAEAEIQREIHNAALFQVRPAEDFQLMPWPESADKARLAMVTRLDCNVKGIDLAVEALARVNRAGLRARLDIFGEGFDRARVQQMLRDAGENAGVELMGGTQDVSEVWRDHELLLMPSRTEGLGLSMLEAMSCGRPVLRTPLGGCEEWIEDGVNGFVCPRADVDSLVETLERALALRDKWREMGLAAHAKIKRDLDPRPGRVFLEALQPEAER